jgi:hypothetical protein
MEMTAPAADTADLISPLTQVFEPAPDQMAERAAWALALAAWMHGPDADDLPLPAPEPAPALPDEMPVEWWHVMPHASDWWM